MILMKREQYHFWNNIISDQAITAAVFNMKYFLILFFFVLQSKLNFKILSGVSTTAVADNQFSEFAELRLRVYSKYL